MFKSNRREIQAYRKRYEDGIFGGPFAVVFKFDPALVNFTPNMDKRATSVFATSPIVQGDASNLSGLTDDVILIPQGDEIVAHPEGEFHANLDGHQGSMVFWFTPEYSSADLTSGSHYFFWTSGNFFAYYDYANNRYRLRAGTTTVNLSAAIVAGTTYFVVFRWDYKNTLDGTNHICVSVNDVHIFGDSTGQDIPGVGTNITFGNASTQDQATSAILEGFTVYRRPLWDGSYGVAANWDDSGPIDEINAIYAAGAGQDPCLVTGSWDVVFCLPTNSTAEALTTGTGEAWSHPHSSGVLQHQWLEDGGYLGRPWAVLFNGTTTSINCGSGATLDDLADNVFTAEAWIRADSYGEGNTVGIIVGKRGTGGVGWSLFTLNTGGLSARVKCATTDATSNSGLDDFTADSKWHHVLMYFDDAGDRKIYLAIDGKWITSYSEQVAGNGLIVTDVAEDLILGAFSNGTFTFDGCIGWVAISNNDRYSHGTDFIPPRQPIGVDGNHVEMWHLDEGTGALINAEVTSPANDGTLANGTWEEQWDIETTPIVPYSVEFNGTDTAVDCGSAADIDDIPVGGDITAEAWIKVDADAASNNLYILSKFNNAVDAGWRLQIRATGVVRLLVFLDNTIVLVDGSDDLRDGKWHHIAGHYDNTTKIGNLFVDGLLIGTDTGVGNYVTEAGMNCYIGAGDNGIGLPVLFFDGLVGFTRISDNARYTADFTPPSRLNPPGVDGNTLRQFNFRDGAGTTLTDANGVANGTISNGVWRITPDQEIDSPGERIYQWGYVIGNDAADEGITQIYSGLDAGENYVVRAVGTVEAASRGRNKLIVYDETNGAQITALEGPSYHGNHDGGAGAANLTDTTARFPQMLVGWTVYNITDGSSCVCTAISGDMQTITTPLAGGGANLWGIGDEYRIVPPGGPAYYDDFPWAETFTFELPTIARNGAAADCVSISFKMVNGVNEGVLKWAQVELLENLVDNPSLETGAGNPWIPDGWTNNLLDAGDTQAEAGVLHSGVGSLRVNAGAIASESVYIETAIGAGQFATIGGWAYNHGLIDGVHQDRFVHQATLATLFQLDQSNSIAWEHLVGVARERSANGRIGLLGEAAIHYWDDIYVFKLDLVALTVTPASEANSIENGGLRVDGRDACTQPIPAGDLGATSGHIKWKQTFRHGDGDFLKFGSAGPESMLAWFNANNYINVWSDLATRMRLRFNIGGVLTTANWTPTNIVAGTEYLMEVKYNATQAELIVDGVTQLTIIPGAGIDFGANIPTTAYWGTNDLGTQQSDSVFNAP